MNGAKYLILAEILWDVGLGILMLGLGAIFFTDIFSADKLLTGVTLIVLGPVVFSIGLLLKLIHTPDHK